MSPPSRKTGFYIANIPLPPPIDARSYFRVQAFEQVHAAFGEERFRASRRLHIDKRFSSRRAPEAKPGNFLVILLSQGDFARELNDILAEESPYQRLHRSSIDQSRSNLGGSDIAEKAGV